MAEAAEAVLDGYQLLCVGHINFFTTGVDGW